MQPRDSLDARWVAWLRAWMDRGADMSRPVEELRRHGFTDAAIVRGLEAARPRGNALLDGAMQAVPLVRLAPPNLQRIEAAGFPLYTLTDFLSPPECQEIIDMIPGHLQPSPLTFSTYDEAFRTSTTANLYEIDDPRARAVDEKICRTLGIQHSYSEGIQAQRYDVGQQFKPHFDAFQPDSNVFQRFAGVRGNRTWTFMVYLNEGMEGGATRFVDVGVSVTPKAGMALFWYNLDADGRPNRATRHCGEPVTRGHKVIITKWFRVHGDGPVFYP